ncbi:hypothetical protein GQ600_8960 [Phytophthora cactorum]|nr:hypothetical protein GQ600_8960 [Phytophthora cactorum]
MLSQRQLAEDKLFTLVAFDRLSLRNIIIFGASGFPRSIINTNVSLLSKLGRALNKDDRDAPWRPQLIDTVEIGTRSAWGGGGGGSGERHNPTQALAYQTRFGQPALFLT